MFLAAISIQDGAGLITGMTPYQLMTVIALSCIAIAGLLWVVRWLIDERVGDLPQDIKDIKRELQDIGREITDIKINQTRFEGRLWSRDDVVDSIEQECQKEIRQHMESCPFRPAGSKKTT